MAPPPATHAGPPPTLPPSVEEAYRRKCIALRQRTLEIQAENDKARARLSRINRGIEKQRLERAFLLEQLAKRSSTNVEDSEGSPSPPHTPKEKPLRTKRGHRKPSFLTSLDQAPSYATQGPGGTATMSPSGSDHPNGSTREMPKTEEDVEMGDAGDAGEDTEAEAGGFTAVNRS